MPWRHAWILMLASWILAGWTKPYVPDDKVPVKDHADRLHFITLKVDGKIVVVNDKSEVAIPYGSKVEVEDALLQNGKSPDRVNVIGFTHHGWPSDEDRSRVFNTAEDLMTNWSEAEGGRVYAITASTKKSQNGVVYFRLLRPELRFAELTVNGKRRVMRDGESLQLRASDRIKVTKVETNLDNAEDIVFQILEIAKKKSSEPVMAPSGYTHEIQFKRHDLVFARIPLKVVD